MAIIEILLLIFFTNSYFNFMKCKIKSPGIFLSINIISIININTKTAMFFFLCVLYIFIYIFLLIIWFLNNHYFELVIFLTSFVLGFYYINNNKPIIVSTNERIFTPLFYMVFFPKAFFVFYLIIFIIKHHINIIKFTDLFIILLTMIYDILIFVPARITACFCLLCGNFINSSLFFKKNCLKISLNNNKILFGVSNSVLYNMNYGEEIRLINKLFFCWILLGLILTQIF